MKEKSKTKKVTRRPTNATRAYLRRSLSDRGMSGPMSWTASI